MRTPDLSQLQLQAQQQHHSGRGSASKKAVADADFDSNDSNESEDDNGTGPMNEDAADGLMAWVNMLLARSGTDKRLTGGGSICNRQSFLKARRAVSCIV